MSVASVFISFVLWAVCLRIGLRWAKVRGITIRRVISTTAIVFAAQLLLVLPAAVLRFRAAPLLVPAMLMELVAGLLLPELIIAHQFKVRLRRSFQAWVPTLAVWVVATVVSLLVVQPFLMEAYFVPTNGMAPTILGNHLTGVCPECGRPTAAAVSPFAGHSPPVRRGYMICENFHTSQGVVGPPVFSGDRLLAARYLKPRRWDVLVFRNPSAPAECFMKRLVGLPGETIQIKEGAVWADDMKLTPPDAIRGIQYVTESLNVRVHVWGSADAPAQLGDDEYFVLGDFSANSEDSRFWRQGAPGHNPFAVPQSYVCGVVTHIYWPPHRGRILR